MLQSSFPFIHTVMKKILQVSTLFLLLTPAVRAQIQKGFVDISKIPSIQQHYQAEYTCDQPSDTLAWLIQKSGLHAAFGTTDQLYLRCEIPDAESHKLIETAWRGERVNAQVLVWSPDTVSQVRFSVSNLVSKNGEVINRDNVKLKMVRYVVSNFPYGGNAIDCEGPLDSTWLMPDRFESFERFDLPGRSVRPVWMSVDIPSNAQPGTYGGTLEINSVKNAVKLDINLTVQKQVLPKPHDWTFRLDLWQNPWVIANYYQVIPWSADHKALLKKHLKLYADAGGTFITTYAIHSPWSDNSYTVEGAMIESIRTASGSFKFDYTIFDQYVELAMETGIDRAITVYTPLPWADRFRYLDEQSGNYVYSTWPPDSQQYKEFWNYLLDDLKNHLLIKEWLNKTYIGINENPMVHTLAAIKVIKGNSKDWKITYAGDWHPELNGLLDDYSTVITSEPGLKGIGERSTRGFTTTYYVCCTPSKPNNFVFSPPVEGRYIGWYAAACGYNGFLRWAYDAWPGDPERDARHTLWPAGDCFMVYPGGNSCIRFEKLREGIVDYEKINILKKLAAKSSTVKAGELVKELDIYLATLSGERNHSKRDFSTSKMIESLNKGKELIKKLSDEVER